MWRILTRVFPLAVCAFFISTFLEQATISIFFSTKIENLIEEEAKEFDLLLKYYFRDDLPPDAWQQHFENFKSNTSYTLTIISLNDLPTLSDEKRAQLMQGDVINLVKIGFRTIDVDFVKRIGDGERALLITDGGAGALDFLEFLLDLSIILMTLLITSIWSYFHWSELRGVMRAAELIGNGDFSARAVENKYSSTLPFARQLNQMAVYIQRLVNGQRELIHSVSHELRTPISRLDFGLELLKQSTDDEHLNQRIDDMVEDVAELNKLVDELLQLATVGQQYKLKMTEFDLVELLRYCGQIFVQKKEKYQVVFNLPSNRCAYIGDQRLLERAINNLLSNAFKYAKQKVVISLINHSDCYELQIDDDGIGIPNNERQRVFEPFYRLTDSWDKSTQGYGLGLPMVQRIVQVHSGSISVTDSFLGGAKFILYLPKVLAKE